MTEPVSYTVDDAGVARITLERPEAMNSLDLATKEALKEIVERAAADQDARAVVLTGTGRAFCVGQDLREHAASLEAKPVDEVWATVSRHYSPIAAALVTMPKPVVAAVNGIAAGAGASLAFACDLRIVADSAGFNLAFSGIGLSCDTGASWTLPRLIGHARAAELLLQPRTVDAAEALALGLANRVVAADELADTVDELATRLAAGPTTAFAAIRRALAYAASHSLEESLAYEGELMALTGSTQDHRDAVRAFTAKRQPTFQGH